MFYVLEGMDGCGKSSQLKLIADYFGQAHVSLLLTREPGGNAIAEMLRDILLDPRNKALNCRTEALLMAAARAQHVAETIRPALDEGVTVLSDRYVLSSLAYQGVLRQLGITTVYEINEFAMNGVTPNITFLIDIDEGLAARRLRAEGRQLDRLESDVINSLGVLRRAYLEAAKFQDDVVIIDGNHSVDGVFEQIKEHLVRSC